MSALPSPFLTTDEESSRLPEPSFLPKSDSSQTVHFPPWYSGSGISEVHQHLSHNRSVQLGIPPSWKTSDVSDEIIQEWNVSKGNQRYPTGGPSHGKSSNTEKTSFYCDACNRGFGTQEELDEHTSLHIKCPFDTCKFQAHPKVVALHQKLQHATGLAEKLICLDTPEGIRRWREERKRNFPTASNIERKKKETAEKQARGEDLQNKYFGKMKQKNQSAHQNRQQNGVRERGRGHRRNRSRKRPAKSSSPLTQNACPVTANIAQEQGTTLASQESSALSTSSVMEPCSSVPGKDTVMEEGSSDELEEGEIRDSSPSDEKAALAVGGSLSLLADYGSDSDSNFEEEQGHKLSKSSRQSRYPPQPVPDLFPTMQKKQPRERNLSLLEKLLASEIRHERNVILQCVHYTVRKQFFDEKNKK